MIDIRSAHGALGAKSGEDQPEFVYYKGINQRSSHFKTITLYIYIYLVYPNIL